METTVGIVTALNPVLGYEKATELADEAYKSGKGILEIIREKKLLTEAQITDLLDPAKLTNLDRINVSSQRNQEVTVVGLIAHSKRSNVMKPYGTHRSAWRSWPSP